MALWGRVIATVTPIHPAKKMAAKKSAVPQVGQPEPQPPKSPQPKSPQPKPVVFAKPAASRAKHALRANAATARPAGRSAPNNLDSRWDRRIDRGGLIPDIHLDLHETSLSAAHARLDQTLETAILQKMRVILLVTGKAANHDRHSGKGRGAIASLVRDWLGASRHAAAIAAVRTAHPRHGGNGALYIILRR